MRSELPICYLLSREGSQTVREACDADLQRVRAERRRRGERTLLICSANRTQQLENAFREFARRVRVMAAGASRESVLELLQIVERVEGSAEP